MEKNETKNNREDTRKRNYMSNYLDNYIKENNLLGDSMICHNYSKILYNN